MTSAAIKEVVTTEVTLTMTREQAETLRLICCRIGGDPKTSRRRHMDAIADALCGIGIEQASYVSHPNFKQSTGFYFGDEFNG